MALGWAYDESILECLMNILEDYEQVVSNRSCEEFYIKNTPMNREFFKKYNEYLAEGDPDYIDDEVADKDEEICLWGSGVASFLFDILKEYKNRLEEVKK